MAEKISKKTEEVIPISPEVAAAIVRSGVKLTVLRGNGEVGGQSAAAEIGKGDVVEMVKTGTVPEGAVIVSGSK